MNTQIKLFIPTDEPQTINHWGHWVSSNDPVTGVVSCHNVEWIYEEIDYRAVTNLSYDGYMEQNIADMTRAWQNRQGEDDMTPDEDLLEEWRDQLGEQYEESGDTYLIGSWYFDDASKQWEVNKSPDLADDDAYAAIVDCDFSGGIVQVVWSRFVTRGGLCSPCCPGQVDLDNEGEFVGYDLPLSLYGEYRQNTNPQLRYWIVDGDDAYWGNEDLRDWARLTNSHIYPRPNLG